MVRTRARDYPILNLQNMSTSEEQIAQLTQVANALREQITNLNQQVTNQATELQAARAQANQVQVNQQVAFAMNPVRATTTLIDMMSKSGMKMYDSCFRLNCHI